MGLIRSRGWAGGVARGGPPSWGTEGWGGYWPISGMEERARLRIAGAGRFAEWFVDPQPALAGRLSENRPIVGEYAKSCRNTDGPAWRAQASKDQGVEGKFGVGSVSGRCRETCHYHTG